MHMDSSGAFPTAVLVLTLALGAVADGRAQTGASAIKQSAGVYRIPYEDGTKVRVSRDHATHTPIGRIDMGGREGTAPYRIVAAADGTIRFIEDSFSKRIDSDSDEPCENNFVWIEHANGEWSKYSHMRKNSSTGKAKLKVGQSVKAGTYLGDEGEVGCAGGPHLHMEIAVMRATNPITAVGGFVADNEGSKRNRIPRICGVAGRRFVAGTTYEAKKVPGNVARGAKEVARHGVAADEYQCVFDQAAASNYHVAWINGYQAGGKTYYNVIFRPNDGKSRAAFHGLTGAAYQAEFAKRKQQGFRLTHVDAYRTAGGVRYAAVFAKDGGPAITAYHGIAAADHQKRFDDLTKQGWRPKNVAVVSVNGNRSYTVLYEKASGGGYFVKSSLTPAQYQQEFDANRQAGRHLQYLNAYEHNGSPYFSAIWSSGGQGASKARHGLTSAEYQKEWQEATQAGMLTQAVAAYLQGTVVRYAAVWR